MGAWPKGKRDQFILATKCAGQMGPKPWDQGMSRKHILDAIDASLRRLGTDYIDLYRICSSLVFPAFTGRVGNELAAGNMIVDTITGDLDSKLREWPISPTSSQLEVTPRERTR